MSELNIADYMRAGTPESVLVKAGMVRVADVDGYPKVVAGPKLATLFENGEVPQIDTIAGSLTDMVFADLYDRSGYLQGVAIRMQAVGVLRDEGLSNVGLHALDKAIAESVNSLKAMKAEEARSPRPYS